MHRATIDFWVGIFVLMGFGAMLVLALKVGNLGLNGSNETYSVTIPFSNIGGLKARAPVRASGVTVGRVTDIIFDNKKYEANVKVEIEKGYQFPKDTAASILTSGILGENYVGLEAGAEEEFLKNGDRIVITQSAVVLERLIGQFLYSKAQESNSGSSTGANAKSDLSNPPGSPGAAKQN